MSICQESLDIRIKARRLRVYDATKRATYYEFTHLLDSTEHSIDKRSFLPSSGQILYQPDPTMVQVSSILAMPPEPPVRLPSQEQMDLWDKAINTPELLTSQDRHHILDRVHALPGPCWRDNQ